ncbi:hypothetical protein AVEN_193562-1 [Araneus ventricosus]|uniref:Uncharacterized protein n=1 Tax=Araneus ventricosus TaxID=182803 RepID=A0A4Y2IWN2_ARAVE|nr:hypothetical protein AVEN_193562-1 [Araneus ventricosus]
MAIEHFVDRRSPFPSLRFCQYSEFQNMGMRKSFPNANIASSFSKGHCVVRIYGSIYRWPFRFRGNWSLGYCNMYSQWDTYESLWRNQLIPALQKRGCVDSTIFMQKGAPPHFATPVKQLLNLHLEMTELSVAISQQPGSHDHLTSSLATPGCGVT